MTLAEPARAPGRRLDAVSWLTLFVVLLFAVPSRLVIGPLGAVGAPSTVMGMCTLGWWVLFVLGRWRGRHLPVTPLHVAMGIFLAAICASYLAAMLRPIDPQEVSTADTALLAAAAWTGIVLVSTDGVPSRARLDRLVRVLVVAAAALAVLGLAQFVTGQVIVDRISIPGLTETYPPGSFTRHGFARPSGTAAHPIEFGVLVTMLLPFTLHHAFHGTGRSRLTRWAPALLTAAFVPLSSTRSVFLGAAVVVLILLPTWTRQQRAVALGGSAALLLAVFVAVPGVLGSIRGMFSGISSDPSAQSRLVNFDIVWEFVARAPLFGRGSGTFLPAYRIFDNQFLLLLVTVGVVGSLAFVGVVATVVATMTRLRRRTTDAATRSLAQSITASVAAGTLSLAFFDAFSFPMTAGTVFLVVGLSGALWRLARTDPRTSPSVDGDRSTAAAAGRDRTEPNGRNTIRSGPTGGA